MQKIKDLVNIFNNNQKKLISFYKDLFEKITANKKYNFFIELYIEEVMKKIKSPLFYKKYKNKPLFGVPFFLKDNFTVNGKITSAGSKILEGFIPNFDSTVHKLLTDDGAILLGKTIMDELAMGATGLEAKEGYVLNNLDTNRIVGGSSSGSAVSISLKVASFALGSDTGDSVRRPASFLGIVGFKPTFGLISRFGLLPFSPSLDTVAFFSNSISDARMISKTLFHFDSKDFVCQKNPKLILNKRVDSKIHKILILKPHSKSVKKENNDFFNDNFVVKIINEGFNVSYLSLPDEITTNLLFFYQIISFSESLSSQANLTGINFGFNHKNHQESDFNELIKTNRSLAFRKELKRRYTLGSFFTQQENQKTFYLKAMKFRRYLNDYFNELFNKFDFIIHLSTFDVAPTIEEVLKEKHNKTLVTSINDYLIIANFLGLPSINLPLTKKKDLPIGINVFTRFNDDYFLLNFAEILEKIIIFKKNKINN